MRGQDPVQPQLYTMREGLSQMKTTCLLLDSRGYLWVGTRNGLNRFNGQEFRVYGEADGLPHSRIHAILEADSGKIWILTYGGLSLFDGQRYRNWKRPFLRVLNTMTLDDEGNVWIVEGTEPVFLKFNGTAFEEIPSDGDLILIPDPNDQRIYLSGPGGYFELNAEHRLDTLRRGDRIDIFPAPILNDQDNRACGLIREGNRIFGIYLDDPERNVLEYIDGRIVDLEAHNISVIDVDRIWISTAQGSMPQRIEPFTLPLKMLYDPGGGWWVAAENGLGFIPPPSFRSYQEEELPYAWSTVEDSEGNIWFGCYGFGLYRIAADGGAARRFLAPGMNPTFFAGATRDASGRLYFAHVSGIMTREQDGQMALMLGGTVFHLAYDEARDCILGGTFGAIMVTRGRDTLAMYGPEQGVHSNDYILAVGVDREGWYWGGSYEGLCRINPGSSEVQNFTGQELPGRGVYCIHTDEEGITWFGGDQGLLYYDGQEGRVMQVESAVLNTIVKSIISYNDDFLLVAAKDGLYLFDRKAFTDLSEVALIPLNETTGYPDIEPGFNGLYKDSQNRIWVTSASGVSVMQPDQLDISVRELQIRIHSFNGSDVSFSGTETFRLPSGQAEVEVAYEAIGIARPSTTMYQYRLDDREWSDWSTLDRVFLTDLREGLHSLEVRAGPTDRSVERWPADSLSFSVQLPFWQEFWFPGVAIGTASLLLVFGMVTLWRQRRDRLRLEARVNEVRQLRSQLLLAELNPHFVFNALASIQHQVLLGDRERAADHLVRLSRLIRSFLQATHRGQQMTAGQPERDITLAEELQLLEDYLHFERMKNEGYFDYTITVESGIDPQATFIPPMLLQPFVENGIKHGLLPGPRGGLLELRFAYLEEDDDPSADTLQIRILDNGVGLKHDRSESVKVLSSQQSLGRTIIEERVRLLNKLGYRITVETSERPSGGTEVMVLLREAE